jgi:phytoene dehydrogenase-like protein
MELTAPGFRHDVCAAVHPLGLGSPFLSTLPLEDFGLRWVHPAIPFAHPLNAREAVFVHRSVEATVAEIGGVDGEEYRNRIGPLVEDWDLIANELLGPVLRIPRHPTKMIKFGWVGIQPATTLIDTFRHEAAKALFAGTAGHSFVPLSRPLTSAYALMYPITAHRLGWPFAASGSQAIVDALAGYLRSLGGEIETGRWIARLEDLPPSRVTLLDVTPDLFAQMAGSRLPASYKLRVRRFRRGPAAFKVDYALSAPVPWTNQRLLDVGTLHLGSSASIIASEAANWKGRRPERPFMLVSQPSLFDPSRAPAGHHTLWVYAHVPHASAENYLGVIETEIEALAPGFRNVIIDRCVSAPSDLEAYNPNNAGGDITGGAHTLRQVVFRPFLKLNPYATPLPGVFLCSSSTPPGAGVHGMCGYWAARTALKHLAR